MSKKNNITYKIIDALVETVNFIVISYIIDCFYLSLKSHCFFILLFASNIWFINKYCKAIYDIFKNNKIKIGLLVFSILLEIFIVWYFGVFEVDINTIKLI